MKKKLALLLALCLCLCMFAACGGDAEETAPANTASDVNLPLEESDAPESSEPEAESDLAYVQDKGTLIIGITEFDPMDYRDESGEWIGFDADLARAFAEHLGVEPQFQLIDWDSKILELDGKTIDVVWNGMTLTDEVTSAMECSEPYLNNAQVVVVKADVADQYQTAESLAGLNIAVEAGSAGEAAIAELGYTSTPVLDQATALLEVSSGTCDAAVIDSLMAAAMIGEGTSYDDLTYTVGLTTEEYGIGFRKGSDLAAELDAFLDECYADGSMQTIAETYGVQAALIER
ncbi:MAG TPA: transporter substrate-binding domain-containing protein [Firmicutes bacterium]|nr:transporter substrate-binding domain-containing protein [Bacillota bacterium]